MTNRKQRKPLPYSPQSYGSIREQGSPTKASILLQQNHADYVESLVNRKIDMLKRLQLFTLSYQNQLPQKCLNHNNFITLYCQNQLTLLCVNCIYGTSSHKDHNVVPCNNSIGDISNDNLNKVSFLEDELQKIKHIEVEVRKNKKVLEEEYKAIQKQIQEQFKEIYQMIEKKQIQTKLRVNQQFGRAITLNDIAIKEVSWWKEQLIKTRSSLPKPSIDQNSQVYKHLVLELLTKQKIDEEKLTYMSSGQQIRQQFLRQILQLKESIEQFTGSSNKIQKSKIRMF